MRRSILLRLAYTVLLVAWLRFIWDIRANPSDQPILEWTPVAVLSAQIVDPTMIVWFLIVVAMTFYGAFLTMGLVEGNGWMLEGLVWWGITAAALVTDLLTRYSRSVGRDRQRAAR